MWKTDQSYNNLSDFISDAQPLIDIIALKFVRSKRFSYSELSDIKQSIIEELLKKRSRILDQYKGNASFRTYLSVIIQNICREILRKDKKFIETSVEEFHEEADESLNPEDKIIIDQEITRLKNAILLYYKQKPKLELCLKVRFRIPLDYEDLQKLSPDFRNEDFQQLLKDLGNYSGSTDKHMNSIIIDFLNECEGKQNTADSLRKWINLKITELIEFLNGDPPASNYTEETLQILFEKYVNFISNETGSKRLTII
jgi:hypothetical protein